MPMIQRLGTSLPGPLAAGVGVVEVVLYRVQGPLVACGPIMTMVLVATASYIVGRRRFPKHPKRASYLLEAGMSLQFILAAVGSGIALGLTIQLTPPDSAAEATKAVWAAAIAAIAAFLGMALINPSGDGWNPVKSRIKATFVGRFPDEPEDVYLKDARDAVKLENFGGLAGDHKYVDGWGWAARHLRTKYIQEGLNRLPGGATPHAAAPT